MRSSALETHKRRRPLPALVLTLVLAEAELELVPDAILRHPQVTREARSRDKRAKDVILDSSVHHEALREVPQGHRRGRPDLVHFSMLLALDSALNQDGQLRLYVHTANDLLMTVRPDTRLMRHYPRFIGLMEKLFAEGRVGPAEAPLLTLEPDWSLERVLDAHATGPTVAFSEAGEPVEPHTYLAKRAGEGDLTVVLGAFPHGDFSKPPRDWADAVVGLGGPALSVWTVEMEVLSAWERAVGTFPRKADAAQPSADGKPEADDASIRRS